MVFNDPRRFGFMDLVTHAGLSGHPALSKLGPEPLSPEFDGAALARACRGRKTSLKVALLDQRIVAGIGNIYASEALWAAKVSPTRAAGSLTSPRWERLVEACRSTLEMVWLNDFAGNHGEPPVRESRLPCGSAA